MLKRTGRWCLVERICEAWTKDPTPFKINPHHLIPGPYTLVWIGTTTHQTSKDQHRGSLARRCTHPCVIPITDYACDMADEASPNHSHGRKAITATPLSASLEQLSGLPDALVIVDENDVLRDEGEAYARKLSQAGVRVTSVRYNGTIHDFVLLNALADTPAVRSAVAQTNAALRIALYPTNQDSTRTEIMPAADPSISLPRLGAPAA